MTLQEPTTPGWYWVRWRNSEPTIMRLDNAIGRPLWEANGVFGTWEHDILPGLRAIEPVVPPSWERPRSAMATFDEAVAAQAALYTAHQPPPQPIQLPVEPGEPR